MRRYERQAGEDVLWCCVSFVCRSKKCSLSLILSFYLFLLCRKESASEASEVCQVASSLQALATSIDGRVGALLHKCAVSQWEMRMRVKGGGSGSGAWRVVVSNPTGVSAIAEVRISTLSLHVLPSRSFSILSSLSHSFLLTSLLKPLFYVFFMSCLCLFHVGCCHELREP